MTFIRRRQVLIGGGAAAFAVGALAQPRRGEPEDDLQFGADLTGDDFAVVQTALHPRALAGTSLWRGSPEDDRRSRVVLDNLPTVAAQGIPGKPGNPGSCEAQSFGYCLGAYTAARLPNGQARWTAADPHNQPSAAWLYHWQRVDMQAKACPKGSKAVPYANKLVMTGAPSTAAVPYNPDRLTTADALCQRFDQIDVSNPGPAAQRLAIGSYKTFKGVMGKKDQYLETFKALIRQGHGIAFSGFVANHYNAAAPQLTKGVWASPDGVKKPSGHGQVIVGFDDSLGPHGAFLVQNSFGADWNAGPADDPGRNGRIWWGYDAWFASQQLALIMFPNDPSPPRGARLDGGGTGLFVRESQRSIDNEQGRLTLVLHTARPVELSGITVTGPQGRETSQALSEALRFGYVYVERNTPFQPGRYQVELTGKQGDQSITWRGPVEVA